MPQHRKRRALFLIHNYNDIDHMVPVIDALMRTRQWQCAVISYPLATQGSIDFDCDWRFAYVRETHGVSVSRVEDAASGARLAIALFRFRERLQRWCDRTPSIGSFRGRDLRGLLPWFLMWRFYEQWLALFLTRVSGLGTRLMSRYQPEIVAVDWGLSHGVIAPLLYEAMKQGVPIIQLPHGAWTYEGIYSHPSQIDTGKLEKRTRLPVVVPTAMVIDNVYKGMRALVQGAPKNSLRLLGLARFTPQWQARLASLPKGSAAQPIGDRPRLVWFTTWLMASNRAAVDKTIAVLEEFSDRIDIVLKVHTRNPAHEQADSARCLRPGSRIRLVANEEESFAMTRWADLVMVTQSSIVYDALLLQKPVIYLKYTHDFKCIWEADRVGDCLTSPSALREKLNALASGRYRPEYDDAAVERFLRFCVCGGQSPNDVLPSYVTLFNQAAENERVSVGSAFESALAKWRASGRDVVDQNKPSRIPVVT